MTRQVKCAEPGCDGGCRWIRNDPETGERPCTRQGVRIVPVVSFVTLEGAPVQGEPSTITPGAAGAAPRCPVNPGCTLPAGHAGAHHMEASKELLDAFEDAERAAQVRRGARKRDNVE